MIFCKNYGKFIIGYTLNQIVGSKLPFIQKVLLVFFYNMRKVYLNILEIGLKWLNIFWQKINKC